MNIDDRKVEKPAQDRGTQPEQDATSVIAGRAASISPDAGTDASASPGAEADKEQAESR